MGAARIAMNRQEPGNGSMRRVEGAEKVTGMLAFTEDMPLPGLVHAKLLTSYVARGAIRGIRFDVALTMPGVIAVLTANDLGLDDKKPDDPEQPLARSRVFHVGQPVAAVVADTPEAAAHAA